MYDDPELNAMSQIAVALSGLDSEAVQRILRWAVERYQIKGIAMPGPAQQAPELTERREFEDFASLYDAANPQTGPERALVAGYWFQVIQNQADFDGYSLNRELKHLGDQSRNITRDLDLLIGRTPRLVIQVRKAGNSKQARKRYKLTTEGIRAVERMLSGQRGESA